LFAKKKRGNLREIKPLKFWSARPFKARVLGSSPSRLTTSYNRQNLQNDFQPLFTCIVVLRTKFKNLSPNRRQRSRFLRALTYSSSCPKTNNFGNCLAISRRKALRPYRVKASLDLIEISMSCRQRYRRLFPDQPGANAFR